MNTHTKHIINGVLIDDGISNLIQILWSNNIETIQCCQGGDVVDKENIFTYKSGDVIIEKVHIIFYLKDLDKIKTFLPSNCDYIVGDKTLIGKFEEWLGSFDGVWANFIHMQKCYIDNAILLHNNHNEKLYRCPVCDSGNIKNEVVVENIKVFGITYKNGSYVSGHINNRKLCLDCGIYFATPSHLK